MNYMCRWVYQTGPRLVQNFKDILEAKSRFFKEIFGSNLVTLLCKLGRFTVDVKMFTAMKWSSLQKGCEYFNVLISL
jgi:hypothetical protein